MQIGSLKKLSVFAVQHNSLTGKIPERLGNLGMLRRLDLGFNGLSGIIPATLATIPQLEVVDVRNNSLSGIVPSGNFSHSPSCLFSTSFIFDILFLGLIFFSIILRFKEIK